METRQQGLQPDAILYTAFFSSYSVAAWLCELCCFQGLQPGLQPHTVSHNAFISPTEWDGKESLAALWLGSSRLHLKRALIFIVGLHDGASGLI